MSIPVRFCPGESSKPQLLPEALWTHYFYLNAVLALSWTVLYGGSDGLDATQQLELKKELTHCAVCFGINSIH